MEPLYWVPPDARSLLDVGCNVGEFLIAVGKAFPNVRLAGCDVNARAIAAAQQNLPSADLRVAEADHLPYADASFDCVTCIEVLEHVPPAKWRAAVAEIHRVLVPGGRFILRVPHAGAFAWLDTNNIRFRFPGLYRLLVGRGRRDDGFAAGPAAVKWHYHFSRQELLAIAGAGWRVEATRYGGLLLFPVGDYIRWPFYRLRRGGHPIERLVTRVMALDYAVDYGLSSYGLLLVLAKS
jgi:SAM-dependent methyltransferase